MSRRPTGGKTKTEPPPKPSFEWRDFTSRTQADRDKPADRWELVEVGHKGLSHSSAVPVPIQLRVDGEGVWRVTCRPADLYDHRLENLDSCDPFDRAIDAVQDALLELASRVRYLRGTRPRK